MNFRKSFICIIIAAILSVLFILPAFALDVKTNDSYTWKTVNNVVTCEDESGNPVQGWAKKSDKEIYYFDKNGVMKTGWVKSNRLWYYLDEKTGILVTSSWVDNYYVDETGAMTKIKK